jgi:putative tryptophan/tyrosine transport system substrate-binding protein
MTIRRSRRSAIQELAFAVAGLSLAGCIPHRPRRVRRIGFLIGTAPSLIVAFEEELGRLADARGGTIAVEKRIARANTSDLTVHAAELAAMDLELIVAGALPWALAVRSENPAMPMVIATCPGMVTNGFADSLERPGRHYTGIDELPPEVTARRLEFLKAAAPKITRVALLATTPGRGGHETQVADAQRRADSLGISVKAYRATTLRELEAALVAIADDKMDGLLNFQGGLSLANRQLIVETARMNRWPAIYQSEFFVETGGLMSWAPNQEEQFREAARYVLQILQGARPGDLPVRYPERYYLTINRQAAQQIGLELPLSVLAQAHRVI